MNQLVELSVPRASHNSLTERARGAGVARYEGRIIDHHWPDVTAVIQTSAELRQTLPRYETGEVQAGESVTTSLGQSLTALD